MLCWLTADIYPVGSATTTTTRLFRDLALESRCSRVAERDKLAGYSLASALIDSATPARVGHGRTLVRVLQVG